MVRQKSAPPFDKIKSKIIWAVATKLLLINLFHFEVYRLKNGKNIINNVLAGPKIALIN